MKNNQETTEQLATLPKGTVLQRGNRKRIFLGADKHFVTYKVPSFDVVSTELVYNFHKWLKDASIVSAN